MVREVNDNAVFFSTIAKLREEGYNKFEGISVYSHCLLTGLLAKEIINRMSPLEKQLFPSGSEVIAAIHDVGKINPLFQEKIRESITVPLYKPNSYPGLEKANPKLEALSGWHSGVSFLTLENISEDIARIVGSHHGSCPILDIDADSPLIGGASWNKAREQLIKQIEEKLGKLPHKLSKNSIPLIAGLTTISDWIASGETYFNYSNADIASITQSQINNGVDAAGFVRPKIIHGLTFEEIFNNYHPNSIQNSLYEIVNETGVYILEAQMGEGKTEAALYAAYKMLDNNKASGIYFALPTQLTSDKIYERFTLFLNQILDTSDRHKPLLTHSKSWMYDTELGEDGRPGYSWFNSRKRAILAPFAVGTIDQALLGSLNVKHSFVRLFGLANKVVIIDEVHTYDSYTGSILSFLIQKLRQLECTIIILSATLINKQKIPLLDNHFNENELAENNAYPLISKYSAGTVSYSTPPTCSNREVHINYEEEFDNQAFAIVKDKLLEGEQVLWIENTVDDAQEVFKILSAWALENNIEIALLHSRFTQIDRKRVEDKWVRLYGKDGISERNRHGRILIGTQVLEQSLDLDSDFLVTRIAPSDMLIQRIGRLWRHRRIDAIRPNNSKPEVLILSANFSNIEKNTSSAFGKSGYVYSPYVLYRTVKVWKSLSKITIPSNLREILNLTYSDENEDIFTIADEKKKLLENKQKLIRLANTSMSTICGAMSDNKETRYSEINYCPVLLISSIVSTDKGIIKLLGGEKVELLCSCGNYQQRKEIAKRLEPYIISVESSKAPPISHNDTITKLLSEFLFISDFENERLRIGLVNESGMIRSQVEIENGKFDLFYNSLLGYQAIRRDNG